MPRRNSAFVQEIDHFLPISSLLIILELLCWIIYLTLKAPFRIIAESFNEENNIRSQQPPARPFYSSSQRITTALPRTSTSYSSAAHSSPTSDHDFNAAVTASLNTFYAVPQITRIKHDFASYSIHTQRYITSQANQPTFQQQINELNQQLAAKQDQLTNIEIEHLEKFKDYITQTLMTIPVLLNEEFYDLSTVAQLKEDPQTREPFELKEIQSGRKLIKRFDKLLAKIKQAHGMTHDAIEPEQEQQPSVRCH